MHHFEVEGKNAWIAEPAKPLPGNPWVWCMEFPWAFSYRCGAPEFLQKGFYYGHVEVGNTFASPDALRIMEKFYRKAVAIGLSPKVALMGLSRGGLYAYRFAVNNPEKVSLIYGDAPVCDFKSWPGGKGKSKRSEKDWQSLMSCYRFKDETEALNYPGNPVDNLKILAEHKIPVLHVVGELDTTVPVAENSDVVEKRYKELGGMIQVIRKKSVHHHPHGLDDCTPIVEFIMKYNTK